MRRIQTLPLLFFLSLLAAQSSPAQKKFNTTKGEICFVSNAELEIIKAWSNEVKGIVVPATNQFAFSVPITSFQGFNGPLQREHFLENYLESDSYPNASFSGKIIEQIDFFSDGVYEVRAKGELDIHGQKQSRIIKSKLTIKKGTLLIESQFVVPLSDHNISIPKIISQKIATEIDVTFKAPMTLLP